MQSTLKIFHHFHSTLPPLVTDKIHAEMGAALASFNNNPDVTLDEIEDAMITFGYQVWPWNQTFKEFYARAEQRLGEHFLLPRLPGTIQEKYQDSKNFGGTLRALYSGSLSAWFTSSERLVLGSALVEMSRAIREYAARQAAGTEQADYLGRVAKWSETAEEIKQIIATLAAQAEESVNHPTLAAEIRARAKSFEYGLCGLGPELDYAEVKSALEFFRGRRTDLDRLRGAHIPLAIDWFA